MTKLLLLSLQKFGGGAIDALGFSNGLVKNEFFHQIIISDQNELKEEFLKETPKRKVWTIKTFKSNYFSFFVNTFLLFRWFFLFKIIIKEKPKIIHVIQFHPWVVFLFFLRSILKFKLFYAVHDNPFEPKENPKFLMNFLEKIFIKKADLVFAYSEFMKKSIKKYFPLKKIEVLYLGIYKDLCPNFEKKFDFSGETLNVLFFGRIEKYKGLDTLVEAFKKIKRKDLKVKLIIAGRGEIETSLIEKIKKLDIDLRNYWIEREELCNLLQWCHILVCPYKEGTQSGIINTALAYGIPIIASNVGSFSEFVKDGETGFLIPPNDPEILAQKICFFYENKEKIVEMSKKILEFSNNFSWEKIAQKAIKLYHEYLDNYNRRSWRCCKNHSYFKKT